MKNLVMKQAIFSLVILMSCAYNPYYAQSPGGILEPLLWTTEFDLDQSEDFGTDRFNFHSYQYFDEDRGYTELPIRGLHKISLFVVFSSTHPSQVAQINTGKEIISLTDSTIISRRSQAFDKHVSVPQFVSYVEYLHPQSSQSSAGQILVGSKTVEDQWYEGGIAEVLLYDRLLERKQVDQIESYLSMKYGISQPITDNYYNSRGEIVFAPTEQDGYVHNVTAIGRDDAAALFQRQSHNLYSDTKLTISLGTIASHNEKNRKSITDNCYLFWSDDGGSSVLTKAKHFSSVVKLTETTWKFSTYGDMSNKELMVYLDPSSLENYDPALPTWLLLSGNDHFSSASKRIAMSADTNGILSTSVIAGQQFSDGNKFKFAQGPVLSTLIVIDSTACDDQHASGHIVVDLPDGADPAVPLLRISDEEIALEQGHDGHWYFENMDYGTYTLMVQDQLIQSQVVTLDHAACKNLDEQRSIFPNPVLMGNPFTIKLGDYTESELRLTITDEAGRIVDRSTLSSPQQVVQRKLTTPGSYTVTITGDQYHNSYKLLVVSN